MTEVAIFHYGVKQSARVVAPGRVVCPCCGRQFRAVTDFAPPKDATPKYRKINGTWFSDRVVTVSSGAAA